MTLLKRQRLAATAASLDDLPPRPETARAREVWEQTLRPQLQKGEAARRKAVRALAAWAVAGVFAGLAAWALLSGPVDAEDGLAVSGAILAGAAFLVWPGIALAQQSRMTKQLVVGEAAKLYGFTFDSMRDGTANSAFKRAEPPTPAFETLKQAGLLPSHNRRGFEDLFTGTRNGARCSIHEAELERKGNKSSTTVFRGMLIQAEFPDAFAARTVIARDRKLKLGGLLGRRKSGLARVRLESVELEDAFDVYSTDQVEARTLLTPDRMLKLIALEEQLRGSRMRGVFDGNRMTLAVEAPDQFGGGSVFSPLAQEARFAEALAELGLVCDVLDGFMNRGLVPGRNPRTPLPAAP